MLNQRSYLIISLIIAIIVMGGRSLEAADGQTVVMVEFHDPSAVDAILADYQLDLVDSVPILGLFTVRGDAGYENGLQVDWRVKHLEIEQPFQGQPHLFGFSDSDITAQPHLFGFGDIENELVDQYAAQQIRLAQAQAISSGEHMVVAVLDSGVQGDHPHFDGRLLAGYDFLDEDDDPSDDIDGIDNNGNGYIDESAGHGTHVAGIVSIVAPNADILPVRIFDSDGTGTYSDAIEGIVYAVEQGADVINISGSGLEDSLFLEAAVQYADAHGTVIVAAGGANQLGYPASYDEVIAVGASDQDDIMMNFAIFADEINAIYAPGYSILSPFPEDTYAYWSGNSMATPFVSGLSALMLTVGACDADCVRDLMSTSATEIDDGGSSHLRIDAYKAVVAAAFTNRSSAGIQALYTFREGSGNVVFDVSGVGAPLDLVLEDGGMVEWLPEGGLALIENGRLASADPAYKLIEATQASEAITIEAWVVPGSLQQRGPARIVTLSEDNRHINAMVGQIGKRVAARFRTTETPSNGKPNLKTEYKTFDAGLNHVIYSRDAAGYEAIYVNNALVYEGERAGSTSAWDAYRLVLGDELSGGKAWQGIYHLVAFYDYAFDQADVAHQFEAGSGIALGPAVRPFGTVAVPGDAGQRVSENLQVLYDFSAGSGDVVPDISGVGEPLNLVVENVNAVSWLPDGGLSVDAGTLVGSSEPATKLIEASRESGELTIEAWITPQEGAESDPARLVTLSAEKQRAFTVDQRGSRIDVRLVTTESSGRRDSRVLVYDLLHAEQLSHVVYTRDALGAVRLYLDGQLIATDATYGTFTFWRHDLRLLLSNNLDGEKPWLGDYHLLAVFNRALSAEEVAHNFNIGTPGSD